MARELQCGTCCDSLGSTKNTTDYSFIKLKDKGGLFKPSKDLVKVCEETEKRFLRLLKCTGGKLPQGRSKLNLSLVQK